MENHRCLAVPNTTIKRCRYSTSNGNSFCNIHEKIKNKNFSIQIYNGTIITFDKYTMEIKSCTPQIFLWKEINRTFDKTKNKLHKRYIENQAKIIKCGRQNEIIEALIQTGVFATSDEIYSLFQIKNIKKLKKKNLENAKHFLGVIYYFNRKIETLKKFQILIHIKIAYGNHINIITKIQKWYRYRKYIKSLPVQPIVMRKHFIPRLDKIIIIQKQIRKYINVKVKHSHNCPYSMDKYWDIPKKYRAVYKHKQGVNYHWRYYDIRWLHNDFLSQTSKKRYVVDPVTKLEFPESFVEQIARQSWVLTRKENDYLNFSGVDVYKTEEDWCRLFERRSLYRFTLMILDLCENLEINIENIKKWRNIHYKIKYQIFYLKVMPALKNIAINTNYHNLEEEMFYMTRDIFRLGYIFPDTDISDEIAGDAIYGIIRILSVAEKTDDNVYDIVKSIIKENVQTLLII